MSRCPISSFFRSIGSSLCSYLAVLAVSALFASPSGALPIKSENFDTAGSASAAGWTEFQSRVNNFDFGFSATNNAEGVSGAGEGGGILARSQPIGYYGDITIGSIDWKAIDLQASGRLKLVDQAFDGEFYFGFFDLLQAELDNRDYLGIRVREPQGGLWRVNASIDSGDNGVTMNLPNDTAFDFSIDWDADGGTLVGEGKIVVTLTSLDGNTVFTSEVEGTDSMGNQNAFGLLSNKQSGTPTQLGEFYFDDLSYSVVPEPSGVALAALGILCPGLCRRRSWR